MSLTRSSRAAALLTKESWEAPSAEELKSVAKKIGVYTLGSFIGSSLGYAANELALPKLMKHLGQKERAILAGGLGIGAGLASTAALNKVLEGNRSGKER
jgi:hypothetical protein